MSPLERVRRVAAADPHLALLVLYGSRARGDAGPNSDWDFGYIADAGFDAAAFLGALVGATGTERVDLVDLDRMSGHLRYRAAADGVVLVERPGAFHAFWRAAVSYWLDMQDVIRAEYHRALERLSP
jgi:predicted nucleotidyltransferase